MPAPGFHRRRGAEGSQPCAPAVSAMNGWPRRACGDDAVVPTPSRRLVRFFRRRGLIDENAPRAYGFMPLCRGAFFVCFARSAMRTTRVELCGCSRAARACDMRMPAPSSHVGPFLRRGRGSRRGGAGLCARNRALYAKRAAQGGGDPFLDMATAVSGEGICYAPTSTCTTRSAPPKTKRNPTIGSTNFSQCVYFMSSMVSVAMTRPVGARYSMAYWPQL